MLEYSVWVTILMLAIIFIVGLIMYRIVSVFFAKFASQQRLHIKYLKKIIKASIIIITVCAAASLLKPARQFLSVILASSGLLVAVLGFAAQESLSNVINGLFISIFKPFEIGDRITLVNNKISGLVEDINLRHTVIKTFTNTKLIIPNSTMNKEMIENSSYNTTKAASFLDVWISYESDIHLAIKIMEDIISKHRLFLDTRENKSDPPVTVLARELGQHGICLRATVWTATVSENFVACSDIRIAIKEEFDKNNIEIPYNHLKIVQ